MDRREPEHEGPQGPVAEGQAVVPGEARPAQARRLPRPPLPARHPAGCQVSGVRCPGVQVAGRPVGDGVPSRQEVVSPAAAKGPLRPPPYESGSAA